MKAGFARVLYSSSSMSRRDLKDSSEKKKCCSAARYVGVIGDSIRTGWVTRFKYFRVSALSETDLPSDSDSEGSSAKLSLQIGIPTCKSDPATMPASNIVRGGIFAAGLAVGVGAASLLNKNNTPTSPISSSPPPRAQVVADEKSTGLVAQGGKPGFTPSRDMAGSLALAPPSSPSNQLASDVFRYGFPGKFRYPE